MIPAIVIMTDIYNSGDNTFYVRPLIRQQKLTKANPAGSLKG